MALKPVKFPAVYERVSPERTEDEINRDMGTRFDTPSKAATRIATTPLAPPPIEREVPAAKTIGKQPVRSPRRKPPGRPSLKKVLGPCTVHEWKRIGKSKTEGKMRRRCRKCKREETVPEAQSPVGVYRERKKKT